MLYIVCYIQIYACVCLSVCLLPDEPGRGAEGGPGPARAAAVRPASRAKGPIIAVIIIIIIIIIIIMMIMMMIIIIIIIMIIRIIMIIIIIIIILTIVILIISIIIIIIINISMINMFPHADGFDAIGILAF